MTRPMTGGYDIATYGTVSKALVTVLLVVWWLVGPEVGFCPIGGTDGNCGGTDGNCGGTIWEHLVWPLSHANVWHLAGNLYFIWVMKGRLHVREAYVLAVLCSFLPVLPGVWDFSAGEAVRPMATCGFSGVLCAMVGVKWGRWIRGCNNIAAYGTFARRVLLFVAAGALIPYVNWSIHLYCVMAGVAYGMVAVIRQHTGQWP